MAVGWLIGSTGFLFGQGCPLLNPIQGPGLVCPGVQVVYSVTTDNSPANSYEWTLLDGGGVVIGSNTGTTFTVLWQSVNGGPFTILMEETNQMLCTQGNVLDVTVADDIARYPFNCFSEVNIPLDNNCEKLILPEHLLTSGVPDCDNTFEITLTLDGDVVVPNPVNESYVGEIITATITHPESGRSCSSLITLKDGTAPILTCNNDTTICNDPLAWDPFNASFAQPTVTDNCSGDIIPQPQGYEWVKIFNDPVISDLVIRSWEAIDKYGNRSECHDTLFIRRVIFDEIMCPPDTVIACDAAYFDPNDPLTSGVPTFDSLPIYSNVTYCDFGIEYTDRITYKCPGNYTIYRDWEITDLNGPVLQQMNCHQVIEVIDTSGPLVTFDTSEVSYEQHPNLFGVDPTRLYKTVYFPTLDYTCVAHGYFPKPEVRDFCSSSDSLVVDISWSNGHIRYNTWEQDKHLRFENLGKGKHVVTIQVADGCHNFTYDTLIAVAEDLKAPFMAVDRYPVVTLGNYAEVTWIDVSVFDEGTWDNCHLYKILGRRIDWDTACGYTTDSTTLSVVRDHYDNFYDWIRSDGDSLCLDTIHYGFTDQIPFCCDDACGNEKVVIELIAIDASCNVTKSWVNVLVEDKSAPEVRHRLPDLEISCYAFNNYYRSEIEQDNWDVFGKYVPFDRYGDASRTIIKDHICTDDPGLDGDYHETLIDTIYDGVVLDNCGYEIRESQKVHFEECGVGWIERQFVFKGTCGSAKADSTKVIQRINIYNDCPLRETDIIWPVKDTTIYECGLVDIETEGPVMKKDDECREIGIHFRDEVIDQLYNADSTCLKIIRKWAVIDWCRQSEPFHAEWIGDQRYHYYEYDQIIYIKNRVAPTFVDCDIDSLCIGSQCNARLHTSVEVMDDCTAPEDILLSWKLYQKTDYGYQQIAGDDTDTASVDALQVGSYKLVWSAIDECHNESFCTDHFDVVDCVKPSPICLTHTTAKLWPVDLDQNGTIDTAIGEIWAIELDVSSHDNCQSELTDFRIRWKGTGQIDEAGELIPPDTSAVKLSLGCGDIGTRMVEMWVVDDHGNADYCEVIVEVTGPIEGCSEDLGLLNGIVSGLQGAGIADVLLQLKQAEDDIGMVKTDGEGIYKFENFRMDHRSYELIPSKTDEPIFGISIQDMIRISRHILGKDELETRFEQEAADVTGDGWISVSDIIVLRKLILGKIDSLPIDQTWKFFNRDMRPWSRLEIPGYEQLLNFTGVKVGDVTGDAAKLEKRGRSSDERYLLHLPPLLSDNHARLPVVASADIQLAGLQCEIAVDRGSHLLDLIPGSLPIAEDAWHISEAGLRLCYVPKNEIAIAAGDTLFYLGVQLSSPNTLDHITVRSSRIPSILYTDTDSVYSLALSTVTTRLAEQISGKAEVFPNPIADEAFLQLIDPQFTEPLELQILGLDGKAYIKESLPMIDLKDWRIGREMLGGPGMYLVHLSSASWSQTIRLVLLE